MQKPLIKAVARTKHQAMLSEANWLFVAVFCQVSNDKNGHVQPSLPDRFTKAQGRNQLSTHGPLQLNVGHGGVIVKTRLATRVPPSINKKWRGYCRNLRRIHLFLLSRPVFRPGGLRCEWPF
jgi:hypothetical protein